MFVSVHTPAPAPIHFRPDPDTSKKYRIIKCHDTLHVMHLPSLRGIYVMCHAFDNHAFLSLSPTLSFILYHLACKVHSSSISGYKVLNTSIRVPTTYTKFKLISKVQQCYL